MVFTFIHSVLESSLNMSQKVFFFYVVCSFIFKDRVSVCGPRCPEVIYFVDKTGLEFIDLLASATPYSQKIILKNRKLLKNKLFQKFGEIAK